MSRATAPSGVGIFVPWSLPVALGALLGALLAVATEVWPALLCSACLAFGGGFLWWRLGWHWPHYLSAGPASLLPFAPVLMLAVALGAVRMLAWQLGPSESARVAIAADWSGSEREWRGRSDGEVLNATHPVNARLSLVMPAGAAVPVGELIVTGTAEPAPGKRNPGGFDYARHLAQGSFSLAASPSRGLPAGSVTVWQGA